jgi:hypothetical protein
MGVFKWAQTVRRTQTRWARHTKVAVSNLGAGITSNTLGQAGFGWAVPLNDSSPFASGH